MYDNPRGNNDDSSFTQDDTSFHDLVIYRRSAERAYEQFAKGDNFIAEGYTHVFSYEKDGQTVTREEFVAKRLGHDVARSSYNVDRTRRQATGVEQAGEPAVTPLIEPSLSAAARPDPTITLYSGSTSLATNAKRLCFSMFAVATPTGFCPPLPAARSAGLRLMNMFEAPTSAMTLACARSYCTRNRASAAFDAT